jgi:hypothetical protein
MVPTSLGLTKQKLTFVAAVQYNELAHAKAALRLLIKPRVHESLFKQFHDTDAALATLIGAWPRHYQSIAAAMDLLTWIK